jgi:hypothetical protein
MAKEYQGIEIVLVGFSKKEEDKFKQEFALEFPEDDDDE